MYDVLIFSAHPDDSEMAIGGTMLQLAAAGHRILNVSLTRGQKSTYGNGQTRLMEFHRAAKYIGCDCLMLEFEDCELENTTAGRESITRILRAHTPKLVFAPYHSNPIGDLGGVSNRDHPLCGQIVRDAVKLARLQKVLPGLPAHTVGKLYFYLLPRHITPTIFVDVSADQKRIKELFHCYESQAQVPNLERLFMTTRQWYGSFLKVEAAEGFVCEMPLQFSADEFFSV